MSDKKSAPATKADLKELATKADIRQLDNKIEQLDKKIDLVKTELKTELCAEIHSVGMKLQSQIDRIDGTLNTKVSTKDDFNRLYNLMDSVAGSVKNYQRQDTLRGDEVMKHDDLLKNHEKRLTTLETK